LESQPRSIDGKLLLPAADANELPTVPVPIHRECRADAGFIGIQKVRATVTHRTRDRETPGNTRNGNSNTGVRRDALLTKVLVRAEKSARRRRSKAAGPLEGEGTQYPAANNAAPLMPGREFGKKDQV
jgi:hypothetical protein